MKALRFRPPSVDPTPDLRWVLRRAFGDPATPAPPPPDPEATLQLARRLDLAARVGARVRKEALRAEVGPAADEFVRTAQFTAASSLFHEATLERLAGVSSGRGIPLVILKGCALGLLRLGPPGARSFGDLDVLVPLDRILELRTALVSEGWVLSPLPGFEHQEAPLTHRSLGMVELHRSIPGVRLPGSRQSLDASALLAAGLTEELPGFGGAVHAPSRLVLLAHALVHGLVQHGYSPLSYPLFRLLGDLQALGAERERLREAGVYLCDFDSGDLDAIATLLDALGSGTALDLPAGSSRSLLHHFVAGSLDPAYALGLKSDPRSLRGPSDLPPLLAVIQWVYRSTVLTRAKVDAIYGPPKRRGGYLARQLLRPFDLALRLARSLRARVR